MSICAKKPGVCDILIVLCKQKEPGQDRRLWSTMIWSNDVLATKSSAMSSIKQFFTFRKRHETLKSH